MANRRPLRMERGTPHIFQRSLFESDILKKLDKGNNCCFVIARPVTQKFKKRYLVGLRKKMRKQDFLVASILEACSSGSYVSPSVAACQLNYLADKNDSSINMLLVNATYGLD